jgi:uncharacterized protein (TIGR02099 family)
LTINTHKLRTTIITAMAITVILLAVVFSLFRAAIPYITDYGDSIEVEVAKQLGLPVDVGMVDADIYWLTPGLKLLDVNIYDAKGERLFLHFDEIKLSIDWFKTIINLKPELGSVSLVGLNLSVERNKKGNFIVQGFEVSGSSQSELILPDELNNFLESASLYLLDSTVRWSDQLNNNQKIELTELNLALVNDAPGHQLSIDTQLPAKYGNRLEVTIDIEGPLMQPMSWNGKAYFGVENLNLQTWFDDYWQSLEFTGKGKVDANIWLEWKDGQFVEIQTILNARNLVLAYLDNNVRSWRLDGILGKGEWKANDRGWTVDVRDLKIKPNNRDWPIPAVLSMDWDQLKQRIEMHGNFLRIEDMAHLAGLAMQFVPIDDFDWNKMVGPYKAQGDLYDINLTLPLDDIEKTKFNARFVDLAYTASGDVPSISGLDGHFFYDTQGVILRLDSRDVDLDFHNNLRNHLQLESLQGELGLYRKSKQWHLESSYLYVKTPHITTETRLDIVVPDEDPVFIDVISRLTNGDGAYTSLYLPVSIMSEPAVDWLDSAFVKADFPLGSFLYRGQIKAFPFKKNEGVMEALFGFRNGELQYQADWPALENLQGRARFYNETMYVDQVQGETYNAHLSNTQVTIDDFNKVHISVKGDVHSPLLDLLKYAENSPLKETFGSYVTSLGVEGQAAVDFNLEIPLETDDEVRVKGVLSFKGNEIYLPNENYLFKDLNGKLSFTEADVSAESLSLSLDGFPMQASVKTRKEKNKEIIRISAEGFVPVNSLLTPLPELNGYISGKTDWQIDIDISDEKNGQQSAVDVFVYSDLQGISSIAPGPFRKKSDQYSPFNLHLGVRDQDLIVDMNYGGALSLQAARENNEWITKIDSESIKGTIRFMQDFNLDIPMDLDLEFIDISAFKTEDEMPGDGIEPEEFPPIEFQSKMMKWEGREFADVSLQTHRTRLGMLVDHLELHGPSISMVGKGSWVSNWRHDNLTSLELTLSTNDFGQCLDKLSLSQSLKKSKGSGKFKWEWPAEPYGFSWDILRGEANFHLRDGSLKDIEAGAGRILGFLNFETLVSLDFGNQVADGFSFDDMTAHFTFSQGHARTNKFNIESKAADINVTGRIGLVDEDYDLEVEIFPKISNAVTVIGVAAGGPALGVAVHFFQKMLGIDKAAGHKSKVTGSWDNPQMVKIAEPEDNTQDEDDDSDIESDF